MPDEVRDSDEQRVQAGDRTPPRVAVRFERVSPVRAYERIVEQVEEAIFAGRLRPGQHLPSERDLMTQFGVGRSSVREALRVLQSNGMVRSRPGDPRGPEVLPVSVEPLHQAMTRLVRANGLGFGELLQFQMMLEGTAAMLVARTRSPEQLAELAAALEAMRGAVAGGCAGFNRAVAAFHATVARATGNPLIQVCAEVVRETVGRLTADGPLNTEGQHALVLSSLRRHSAVFEAVRDGDGPRAAALVRRDVYDRYAGHLPAAQRAVLRSLLDEHPQS